MSLLPSKSGYCPKIGLKSKECVDAVLQPLKDHVTIKINGSLTCEDIFRTVVNMSVNKNSFTLSQNSINMLLAKHHYDIILRN
jgi:putative transposase